MTVVDLPQPRAAFAPAPNAHDDPRREILAGASVIALFFVGLVGWGAFARMDEAAYAAGAVVVSGHRQSVQAADGGVISVLNVREGDRVTAGQPLVAFASADTQAAERGLAARSIQLQAEIARLDAEQLGRPLVAPPAAFAQLSPEDRVLADNAMAIEQKALAADYGADRARRAALGQRMAQAGQQVVGYQRELEANQRQQGLNGEELAGMRDLAAQGYAPMNRVRALEQSAAALQGDAGAHLAAIGQLRAAAAESQQQIAQGDDERAQQLAEERRRAEDALEQVEPNLKSVSERLARDVARAPVSGVVVGLSVNTIGSVVPPGLRLMEIVPSDARLVAEARVSPRDAGSLKIGQPASLRLAGGGPGLISGVVTRVSPDALVDEHTGQPYLEVEVTVAPHAAAGGRDDAAFRPGAPVEVVIPLRKRTALQYWFEPLTQSFWRDFHER